MELSYDLAYWELAYDMARVPFDPKEEVASNPSSDSSEFCRDRNPGTAKNPRDASPGGDT